MVLQNVSAEVTIPEALLHTVISMAIVFAVLILISFIIYLLKFVPALLAGDRKKKAEESKQAVPAAKTVKPKTEQPAASAGAAAPAGDQQIVAVLAGAVAAYMEAETGVPVEADGLVIRSIKKRSF